MTNQNERWRYENTRGDYPRRDRQQQEREDERYRSTYRHGRPGSRWTESSEDRAGSQRFDFENDAYGRGYWPAGYENDEDRYGTSATHYGLEDERYGIPDQYLTREAGRFRGVSRWRPRHPLYETRADWMQGDSPGAAGGIRGSHRGKGPKGYTRSDERLKEVISERLMDDPEIDASEITVNVAGQKVTLDGTVESRLVKYQVEELIESCGADDVVNNLRIQRPGQTGQPSYGDTDVTGGGTGTRTRGKT